MCPNCQRLQQAVEGLSVDLQNAEVSLRVERRKANKFKKELEEATLRSPHIADATELFEFWQAKCHHPRSVFDMARKRLAITRLSEFGLDRLKDSIRGYAVDAYEKHGKRFDDFDLILRDAAHVEEGERRWARHREVRDAPKQVIDKLREMFGEPVYDKVTDTFASVCPACMGGSGNGYRPLQLRINGTVAAQCGSCGADFDSIKRAVLWASR